MLNNLIYENRRPFAIVIARMRAQNRLPDFPWLKTLHGIDQGDWIILPDEGWQALVSGNATLWEDLERKLLISSYINQPSLIAVIGHPSERSEPDGVAMGQDEVERIVRRIRSCGLPAEVLGFWAGETGEFERLIEPGHSLDLADEAEVIA